MSKNWFQHYPKGVNQTIQTDKYKSIIDFLEKGFHDYNELPAFENMGKIISYKQLNELSTCFAAYIQNKTNLKPGDRIALQMPNLLQFPIALFGAIKAGLIVVNTNPLYTASEMKHQFTDAGIKGIVIASNFAYNLEKIISNTQIETVIITNIGDCLGGVKTPIVNFVVKNIKKMVPPFSLNNAIKFNHTISLGKKLKYTKPNCLLNDVAFLQYTGGTTGVSKGAMLTHGNILANMEQILEWMKPKLKSKEEIVITALPLYHIFALTVNCLAFFNIGAKNVLITNPRDMNSFMKELTKHKFTVITAVNTLFNSMMNQDQFRTLNFKYLKVAVGGGMAVQASVAEKWKKLTGISIAEGYGLTETSPVVSCNAIDGTERIGTIGIPLPSTEIGIFDDNGKECLVGEPGEIWVKGPQVMKGYWNHIEETNKVFQENWLKTGDIGIVDSEGFFKIVDRKKEMILVSGFNVYPNEVENAISLHPDVVEVGVIGVPDETTNEVVKAFIVTKNQNLTKEEIISHCKNHLTNYKIPKQIEFKQELPKSNVGKILRRILKEESLNQIV